MDLQTVFYIVAIFAFILLIVLLVIVIFFILFLKKMISNTQRQIVGKILEFTKPVDVMKGLGTAFAGNLIMKIKDSFGGKSK